MSVKRPQHRPLLPRRLCLRPGVTITVFFAFFFYTYYNSRKKLSGGKGWEDKSPGYSRERERIMLTILIVDDERLERNGIKFLLKREEEEFRILEAENGKDALGILASNHVDIIFSDIKMPYMNGLELTRQVRESYPMMEIVIFSGYNDFTYAREALRYGVVDYVLKPVDPEEFHKTLMRVCDHIRGREEEEERNNAKTDYLMKYFFIDYLYTGSAEKAEKVAHILEQGREKNGLIGRCTRMILAGASNGLFETEEEHFIENLKEQLQREFYYVNLNSNESLFLFTEKYTDYRALAEMIHQFFLKRYETDCYFAVSKDLAGWRQMPDEFRILEQLLQEQFYQPGHHVFVNGEEKDEESWDAEHDSEITERISKDIGYKDITQLKKDFGTLAQKYRQDKQFSEMYVKFVFSGIMKELFEQIPSGDEKNLSRKVERLYRCRKIQDVLEIVSEAMREYEAYISEQEEGFRREISTVKSYIHYHYGEKNIGPETLAAQVYLSPGYLSTIFKDETGVTLNRYIREVRMNKAKELLEGTNMKIAQIAKKVGFANSSYFCRSFREFFGMSPDSCRKGKTDEETDQDI